MKSLTALIISLSVCVAGYAKPHCQDFNNYDNKVTIVFSDDKAGNRYIVSDVRLTPYWNGEEYPATSVKTEIKNRSATVTLTFPHISRFSNPKVTLRINGKRKSFKVCR